jgi:hypothetical protein
MNYGIFFNLSSHGCVFYDNVDLTQDCNKNVFLTFVRA